ncbi:MAG: GNAT family N-acetyltransferase [Anaerolineales bacterium]
MTTPLPPLPAGFTARNARLDEAKIAAEMGKQYSLATSGFADIDGATLRNMWESPNFDPAQDVYFVFSPQGKLVGYYETWANNLPPVHPFVWGAVDVDFHNLGIGTHMLAWAENRARQLLDKVPPEARVAPVTGCEHHLENAKALFENNGWTYFRSSYTMRIDFESAPPAPVIPAGITIQTYRPELAEATYRAVNEAFKDHFGHVDQPFESGFANFKRTMLEDPLFDPSLWYLAMDDDEIVGTCLCRKEAWDDPECGHIRSLGVLRPWRKHGLGLALLNQSFGEFHRRGTRKVSLGVDALNITGALRLYEKAGMRVLRQFDQYEKEIRPGVELRVQ